MAIVKLKEILKINSGKKPNTNLHMYITENHDKGINWLKQKDLDSWKLMKTSNFFKKEFINLTKYTNGKNIYFFPDCDIKFFESEIDFCFDGHTWELLIDENKVLKKYFLYKMNNEILNLKALQSGTTLKFITKDIFYNYEINIPTLKEQKEIMNIIEPFEKKMYSIKKINNKLEKMFLSCNDDLVKLKSISTIMTGKRNASFQNDLGKYNFYTCSLKNKQKYCNSYSFDGEYLILSGNGDVGNVEYTNSKFDAYQRCYVIKVLDGYIGNAYVSLLKNKTNFENNSKGSVLKFLRLEDFDDVYVSTNKYVNDVNYLLLKLIYKNKQIISVFNKILSILIQYYFC